MVIVCSSRLLQIIRFGGRLAAGVSGRPAASALPLISVGQLEWRRANETKP